MLSPALQAESRAFQKIPWTIAHPSKALARHFWYFYSKRLARLFLNK
jgi:hypothetical protein